MIRRPPRSTRTDTLCPYTTLFRSEQADLWRVGDSTFDIEDVLLNRSPAGAAERLRPVRCDPAFGVESPLPARDVRAIKLEALTSALCLTARSEGCRVGYECCRTCRSRWTPYHYKNNTLAKKKEQ